MEWAGPSVPDQQKPRRQTLGWICDFAAEQFAEEEEEASSDVDDQQ